MERRSRRPRPQNNGARHTKLSALAMASRDEPWLACDLPRVSLGSLPGEAGRRRIAMRDTWPLLEQIAFPPIRRGRLDTLQVNVGYRCNQSCVHCQVNAGPNRTEEMAADIVDVVLAYLAAKRIPTLDLTGGAPELNANFRRLV